MPVGEADALYVGTWNAVTLEMEGESYNVAEMGVEMNFTLNADGTAQFYDGEITEDGTWTIEDGMLIVDGMALPLCEDGQLLMEDEDSKLFFVKSDAASAIPATETEGFTGTWYGCYMATGAIDGDPRELLKSR